MSDISLNSNSIYQGLQIGKTTAIKPTQEPVNNLKLESLSIKDHNETKSLNLGKAVPKENLFENITNNSNKLSPLNNDLIKNIQKSGFKGDVSIDSFKGNSNRETAILTSPNFDPKKPAEVVYLLHGMHKDGSINGALFHSEGGVIDKLKNTNKNIILVIPQGPHSTSNGDNGGVSKDPDYNLKTHEWFSSADKNASFSDFKHEVENKIKDNFGKNIKINSSTIAGHSAGGKVLANIAERNKDSLSSFSKVIKDRKSVV